MDISSLHPSAWASLQGRRARLPHALLISGRRGIGKFELAKYFAKSLLCEKRADEGRSCNVCGSCHWFEQGHHPDLRFLLPEALEGTLFPTIKQGDEDIQEKSTDGKTEKKSSQQITIEQVRSLNEFLSVGTHRQGLRIILLYPAEAMNRNAANALLKSLEEPNSSTLFLLVSSEKETLLPTIRSRCQSVSVPLPAEERSLAYLRHHGHESRELANYLVWAGGSPFIASDLAKQGAVDWLNVLFEGLVCGGRVQTYGVAAQLDDILKKTRQGRGVQEICEWVQRWTHDLWLAANGLPPRFFRERQKAFQSLATSLDSRGLAHFYRDQLLPLQRCAGQPLNQRLFLETLLNSYRGMFVVA